MKYACIAETKKGARCRRWAVNGNSFCSQHAKVKSVKIASLPNLLIMKFRVNKKWTKRFFRVGIEKTESFLSLKEKNHFSQAKKIGRNPYRYSEKPASGVPVFGREGLRQVGIKHLFRELIKKGYGIIEIHIEPTEQGIMNLLVIVLEQNGKKIVLSEKAIKLFENFLWVCWGHVHVWVNPIQNGKVVHSVIFAHRNPQNSPNCHLRFRNGLWDIS